MNEQTNEEVRVNTDETIQYALNFDNYSPKEQAIIYLLWKIHNKKIGIGSMIFFEELQQQVNLSKAQWQLVLAFLSGANLVVNQVVIQSTVNKELVNRFGLIDE